MTEKCNTRLCPAAHIVFSRTHTHAHTRTNTHPPSRYDPKDKRELLTVEDLVKACDEVRLAAIAWHTHAAGGTVQLEVSAFRGQGGGLCQPVVHQRSATGPRRPARSWCTRAQLRPKLHCPLLPAAVRRQDRARAIPDGQATVKSIAPVHALPSLTE